jgi:oligopeptide transport system permease protein
MENVHSNISPDLFVPVKKAGNDALQSIQRPTVTYWQDARGRLFKNKIAMCAGIFIVLVTLAAFFIPPMLDYDYEVQEVWNKHALPNAGLVAVVSVNETYTPKTTTRKQDSALTDVPNAPAGFKIVGVPTTKQIVLEWDEVPGADGYRIYRSITDGTLGVPLADVPVTSLSFRDSAGLEAKEEYFYVVTAFNSMGDSSSSSTIKVQPKLVLGLEDAKKFDPSAEPGKEIKTRPHFLGTDYLGRDTLARLLVGTRISLSIGFIAPFIFVFIGIVYGCVSGYFGGMIDNIMMRFADIIVTIPNLLVLIMLQVAMGSGPVTLVIALVIADWAAVSQQVRGEILRIREMEFVHAAELLGTSFWKLIFRHLLPNVMGTVLVLFSIAIPRVIFAEAFLSFIGLGIAPPLPSLGSVTREGAAVMSTYPVQLLIPALLLSMTVLAFNLFGDGMRDALDPKQRGTR